MTQQPTMGDWDLSAFWPEFEAEVQGHLETLEEGLLTLKDTPEPGPVLQELFRAAHTIKGAARMMGLEEMATTAAQAEELLRALHTDEQPITPELINQLLQLTDQMRQALTAHRPDATEASPPPPQGTPSSSPISTPATVMDRDTIQKADVLTVRAEQVNHLTALSRYLHVQHMRLLTTCAQSQTLLSTDRSKPSSGDGVAPEQWYREVRDILADMTITLQQLEGEVLNLRLVPFHLLRTTILRTVHEAAHALGKRVRCTIEGEDTLIDRDLLGPLQDVLTHLLRNAVDHGIEPPEERHRLGKPEDGHIVVSARLEHIEVQIQVKDDGRGIDHQRVLEKAVAQGLVSPADASRLSPDQILRLLFHPGLSTRQEVTMYSGHGVGLDVVATTVRRLGGTVDIQSTPQQGTTITLRLPLNLSLAQVLLLKVGPWSLGVLRSHVVGVLRTDQVHVLTGDDHPYLRWQEAVIPLLSLHRWYPTHEPGQHVLIVRSRRGLIALTDGRVTDMLTLALYPLPPLLAGAPGVQAAAILGDGSVTFVLDIDTLLETPTAQVAVTAGGTPESTLTTRPAPHVLVVDDVFLTRELLRSVLTAAGYRVTAVASGEEALHTLEHTEQVDVILTDVRMPGMDGITLTRRVKSHPRWQHIPVVILSADADPSTIQAGLEAGASAYLTKQDFQQGTLLETIERVL